MENKYTVVNASAGSGKTYNLVLMILIICLRNPNSEKEISHILALTFTNKAANEMKERILEWLEKFSEDNYSGNAELQKIQDILAEEGTQITLEELHLRAKNLLHFVLHNYSLLNIGTIDKFNSKLVRSFSYELGLAQNFNLEINTEPFLLEAVDKTLEQINEESSYTDSFIDYLNYGLDNEQKRINLNQILYNAAKEYVQDKHYHSLQKNKDFSWENYNHLKNQIRTEIKDLKTEALQINEDVLNLLHEKNLGASDFAGGANSGIMLFFNNFKKNGEPTLRDSREDEEKKIVDYLKGASSSGKKRKEEIEEILDYLLSARKKIIDNYVKISKKRAILNQLLPLKVNKDIQEELKKIEQEKDLVFLSKFNVLINENLREEPSGFIFEKVGTQFNHYFFDEFQDTSQMQWNNLIPLRDNAISTDRTTFTLVGDPKQSIYRFRGGDSKIMLDIINKKETTSKFADITNLGENYRSGKNIVEFNNNLYEFSSENLREDHRKLFGEDAKQIPKKHEIEGRIRVNLIENTTVAEFYEQTAAQMLADIQHCADHGFKMKDITVLCRGKAEILELSKLLSSEQIMYYGKKVNVKTISEDGLTLEISPTLQALIHYLYWKNDPKNTQHLVYMLYKLNQSGRIKMDDFSKETAEILSKRNADDIEIHLKIYGLNLNDEKNAKLNLYNSIEADLAKFSVPEKESEFRMNFLEMLYSFSQNPGNSVADFLKYWEEEGRKQKILASENMDAVQLMTIHKAKGLQFPIVMLPLKSSNNKNNIKDWLPTDSGYDLNTVHIHNFDKTIEAYDDEAATFNQENNYNNEIDNLCVQYVATTRPVQQLFFYLQKPKKEEQAGTLLNFVSKYNHGNEDSFEIFPVDESSLFKFEANSDSNKDSKSPEPVRLQELQNSERNSENIKIATPSKNYQNRNEKVRNGIIIHDILAKINSDDDVEIVLKKYCTEGTFTQEELNIAQQKINKIIQDYPVLFDKNAEILNERDILTYNSGVPKIYRPDRIVKKDGAVYIADYKTGYKKDEHEKQIDIYRSLLERMNYKVNEAFIIYIN